MTSPWIKRSHTEEELETLMWDVKAAKVASTNLDARVAFAFGWQHNCDTQRWGIGAPHWYWNGRSISELLDPLAIHGNHARLPNFSSSVDVAKLLIPEGYFLRLSWCDNYAELTDEHGKRDINKDYVACAELAPCAVIMLALTLLIEKLRSENTSKQEE